MSPNAFWNFKSDPTKDKTPSVGVIKPTVDIQQVVQFIQAQLTFWLNSKNIRPGTIGGLASENFASGISKIIDEMDTAEDRQKQVHYFVKAEKEMWSLITKKLHPYWQNQGLIENKMSFSPTVEIDVEFQEQLPLMRRSELLKDIIQELDKGLTTKKRAIKVLNPEMSDKEIDQLVAEIEFDRTSNVETEDEMNEDMMNEEVEENGEASSVSVQG